MLLQLIPDQLRNRATDIPNYEEEDYESSEEDANDGQ